MRHFARALPRGRKSQEAASSMYVRKPRFFTKDGGGLMQLPHLRVGAATGASKIAFLEMYAESGVALTRCSLHQADLQVWALRSSLCLRTVSWLVARVSWAYFGLTCRCHTYFLDAFEEASAFVLWVFVLFSKAPHPSQQLQQWQHARLLVVALRKFYFLRGKWVLTSQAGQILLLSISERSEANRG